PELDRALEGEDHPAEETAQENEGDGADADPVYLHHDVGGVERAGRHEAHRPLAQDEILLHAERRVAHPGIDRGDESAHRVQRSEVPGALQGSGPAVLSGVRTAPEGPETKVLCPLSVSQVVNRISPGRLDALLEAFRDVRVVVVGDLMLDVYLRGSASR